MYQGGGLTGRTILVVEDEFLILMDLQAQLEDAGASVLIARDMAEGQRQADGDHVIDGAILDIRLPDGEVFPLAERLRAMGTPVLFHSGHARAADLQARFPGCLTLSKPALGGELLAKMAGALNDRPAA